MKEQTAFPVKRGPWTTLSSREIYQNPWIRVREDQVLQPGGGQGIYGVVETRAATGVLALTEDNELYLVGQYRYPTERYSWEIIEGGAEEGEEPISAAKRELLEEAHLIAADWQMLQEGIQLSNCHSSELAYFFVARGLTTGIAEEVDPTEELELRRMPLAKAKELVLSGEISDAMSVIGILLLCTKLGI